MYGSDAACRYACRTGACSRVGDRGRANKKPDKDRSRTGICNCRGVIERKNKKNVSLIISIARAYLNVGKLPEAESYLKMAQKVDKKDAGVSVLEGDIALAQKDVGRACQFYEQAIYFNPDCKEAYLKYARAYRSASPSQAIDKLQQLKALAPDFLEADKELAGVYYATNRFGKAAETYAKFIDTPVATEDDILKYAFALFLNHDFEKSLEVVQKGLQKNGRHAAFNRLAMYNYTDLKRYDEAEKAANDFSMPRTMPITPIWITGITVLC